MPGRPLHAVLLLGLAAVAVWNAAYFFPSTVDDAFISLRYAWNLVHGHGLVWNPGEWVEGYSNPTWTLLAAGWLAAGIDGVVALKWTGLALTALLPVVTASYARRLGAAPWVALVAAGTVAADLNIAFWATGGLETPLWNLILLCAVGQMALRVTVGERAPWSAAWLGVAYATRPEAVLFVGAAVALEVVRVVRAPTSRSVAWFCIVGFLVGGWLLTRYVTYGHLVANTYYVKAASGFSIVGFTRYLSSWLVVGSPVTGLLLLAAVGYLALGRNLAARVVVGALVVQAIFVARAGGDWMAQNRFWAPAVPLAALVLAGGATEVLRRHARAGVIGVGLASLGLGFQAFRHLGHDFLYRNPDTQAAVVRERWSSGPATMKARLTGNLWTGVPDRVVKVLQYIPDGAVIAHSEIGLLGYVMDNPILDAFGLCNDRISGATGEPIAEVVDSLAPPDVLLMRKNVPYLDLMHRAAWAAAYTTRATWGTVWVEATGEGELPPLPTEQQWARLTRAVERVPREPMFHVARVELARSAGNPAWETEACARFQEDLPALATMCGAVGVARRATPPDAASPAAASVVPPTPAAPPTPAVRTTPPTWANPGFEILPDGAPTGWTPLGGEDLRWSIVEVPGGHALQVQTVGWMCADWAPVTGPLTIEGRVRTEGVPTGANERQGAAVGVRLRRADGTFETPAIQAWTGTHDWASFSVHFPTDGFTEARPCVGLNGVTGAAWFDDVVASFE